jgi:hypothetical protein
LDKETVPREESRDGVDVVGQVVVHHGKIIMQLVAGYAEA